MKQNKNPTSAMTGQGGWAAEEYVLFRKFWLNGLGGQTDTLTQRSVLRDRWTDRTWYITDSPISEARHTLLQTSLTSGDRDTQVVHG